jgi:hypothetical protein
MRLKRILSVALTVCAALAILASPSGATKLRVPVAEQRAAEFSRHTCAHDESCVREGVLNCRRQSQHIVLCRIFIRRHTDVQGKYKCSRLVRLALVPATHRVKVTGISHWHC